MQQTDALHPIRLRAHPAAVPAAARPPNSDVSVPQAPAPGTAAPDAVAPDAGSHSDLPDA
jgi:hypothetical protein